MKHWLTILCIVMGLLAIIGLYFIAAGLQRENTPQKQLQREMQRIKDSESEFVLFTLSGENPIGRTVHV